jgi:hypothetical protein
MPEARVRNAGPLPVAGAPTSRIRDLLARNPRAPALESPKTDDVRRQREISEVLAEPHKAFLLADYVSLVVLEERRERA